MNGIKDSIALYRYRCFSDHEDERIVGEQTLGSRGKFTNGDVDKLVIDREFEGREIFCVVAGFIVTEPTAEREDAGDMARGEGHSCRVALPLSSVGCCCCCCCCCR